MSKNILIKIPENLLIFLEQLKKDEFKSSMNQTIIDCISFKMNYKNTPASLLNIPQQQRQLSEDIQIPQEPQPLTLEQFIEKYKVLIDPQFFDLFKGFMTRLDPSEYQELQENLEDFIESYWVTVINWFEERISDFKTRKMVTPDKY